MLDTAVSYTTSDASLTSGDWVLEPTVGLAHSVSDKVSVYGEISYEWGMSNDWDSIGGTVEAGLPILVSDRLTLTPSVSRGFDGLSKDWNAKLTASIQF